MDSILANNSLNEPLNFIITIPKSKTKYIHQIISYNNFFSFCPPQLQFICSYYNMHIWIFLPITCNCTKKQSQPSSSTVEMNGLRPPLTNVLSLLMWQPREPKQRVLSPSHSMVFLISARIVLYLHRKVGHQSFKNHFCFEYLDF